MKFGASIWPFQWDPPYEDGISRIASLGFEAVELIGWNRQILHEYYTPKKVKELRAFAEDAGLEISEFVSTPEGMASPDEKERDQAVEHFERSVEVAVGLGTRIMNTVSAYPFDLEFPRIMDRPHLQKWTADIPSGLDWKKNWENYVDVTRRCASICEDAEVLYALEPHPYRHMSNTASMPRLIEHVDSYVVENLLQGPIDLDAFFDTHGSASCARNTFSAAICQHMRPCAPNPSSSRSPTWVRAGC